jgi:hypothetical protein
MPVWRLQTSMMADTALPRDRVVITPHFDDGGVGTDPQGLCDDLAAALHTWCAGAGTREIKVSAYDAQGTVPVFPQGEAVVNPSLAPVSGVMREAALCLSFFSGRNRQRQRGRLYLPCFLFMSPGAALGLRPSAVNMNRVAELAPIFEGLGGPDVDWVVFSRLDNQARPVTDWFVDDEWDIVRSRGLRSSTRVTGTTAEA